MVFVAWRAATPSQAARHAHVWRPRWFVRPVERRQEGNVQQRHANVQPAPRARMPEVARAICDAGRGNKHHRARRCMVLFSARLAAQTPVHYNMTKNEEVDSATPHTAVGVC